MQTNKNMPSFEFNFVPPKTTISYESQKPSFKFLSPLSVTSDVNQKLNINQIKSDSVFKPNQFFSTSKLVQPSVQIKDESNALKSADNRLDSNFKSNSLSDHFIPNEITSDSSQLKRRVAQEIEKIETWKAVTEIDLQKIKDKNNDLKETIDQLRQKNKTIQSENNSLKISINAEISEREEVVIKMENTREMFVRVKNYVEGIENRLNSFEEVKRLIDRVSDQKLQQLRELLEKFFSLDLNHQKAVSHFKECLNLKESQNLELSDKLTQLYNDFNEFKLKAENNVNHLDQTLNEVNARKESLQLEINQIKDKLMAERSETDQIKKKADQLTQQLEDMSRLHESALNSAQQKSEEYEKLKQSLEIDLKELQNKCELLTENKNGFEKRIHELEDIVKNMNEEKSQLLSSNTECNQTIDDLNSKLEALSKEKLIIKTDAENEKQTLIDGYEKSIQELRTNVEILEEKTLELTKLKEENQTLIENLESKANDSLIEKESIETQLQNEMNVLKNESAFQMNELKAKICELEQQNEELKQLKAENETKLSEKETKMNEVLSESEVLKCEKENLEHILENQIANMNKILESCKSDYNKRIEDKEERIKEYKRDSERMQYNVEHLSKKCEKIESEKANISRKLQELTLSTIRSTHSSPNRVLTPKSRQNFNYMSQRTSPSTSPLLPVLSQSPVSHNSVENKSSGKKEITKRKNIKCKTQSKPKAKEMQKSYNDSNSGESVYELLDEKLRKKCDRNKNALKPNSNPSRGKPGRVKSRIDSPVKVNMSSTVNDNTQVYDIENVTKDEPKPKKLKDNLFGLKTYSKHNIRVDNILQGRPTPTKNNDLSWLNF